jgi:hypothetical protein
MQMTKHARPCLPMRAHSLVTTQEARKEKIDSRNENNLRKNTETDTEGGIYNEKWREPRRRRGLLRDLSQSRFQAFLSAFLK